MSLSCALLATSLHQWVRRYIRLTQPARCSPEKRARMREYFADGLDEMHVPWAVEGLPTLLHLSLFLFFAGLVIFLFHVDRGVFGLVVWWIGLFSVVYVSITLLPLIRHDSPYHAPLSTPAWFLYAGIPYLTFKILASVTYRQRYNWGIHTTLKDFRDHFHCWMLGGVEKAAEETVSERLSNIDVRILDWTISALGDDDLLKSFLEAIPGFFESNLVNLVEEDFPREFIKKHNDALDGFLSRNWSNNLVDDSEKLRRLDISLGANSLYGVSSGVSSILHNIYHKYWNQVPQTLEMGQSLGRWCTSHDKSTAYYAQSIIARILASAKKHDDKWVSLASRIFGLQERELRAHIADGHDGVLLAILIHFTCRSLRSELSALLVMEELSELDLHKVLPRLRHDFCTLWNEIVLEARKQRPSTTPTITVCILKDIRHLYIALHQGTDAAPTAFSATTDKHSNILFESSSYPFCNLASHRPDSTARLSVPNSSAFSHPVQPGNSPGASPRSPSHGASIAGPSLPSNSTTTNKIGEASRDLSVIPHTLPAKSGPPLTFAFPLPPATDVCDGSLLDSHDQNQTIPMKVFHHQTESVQPVPSPPNTASSSSEYEGD